MKRSNETKETNGKFLCIRFDSILSGSFDIWSDPITIFYFIYLFILFDSTYPTRFHRFDITIIITTTGFDSIDPNLKN